MRNSDLSGRRGNRNSGRRNEPAFIVHTFEKVAELRGGDPAALAEQLWANANRAMGLDD